MKKDKVYVPKVGDQITVVRIVHVFGGHGNPQDIHSDFIKKIADGKIITKGGFIFNSNGYRVKDRSIFIKEIRFI